MTVALTTNLWLGSSRKKAAFAAIYYYGRPVVMVVLDSSEAAQFMCVRATQIAKAESRLSSVMHAAPLDYRQRPKIASIKGAVINTISRRYATMIC